MVENLELELQNGIEYGLGGSGGERREEGHLILLLYINGGFELSFLSQLKYVVLISLDSRWNIFGGVILLLSTWLPVETRSGQVLCKLACTN